MITFNVGDRVRVTNDSVSPENIGATGTVTAVTSAEWAADPYPIAVHFDKPVGRSFVANDDVFHPTELEPLA